MSKNNRKRIDPFPLHQNPNPPAPVGALKRTLVVQPDGSITTIEGEWSGRKVRDAIASNKASVARAPYFKDGTGPAYNATLYWNPDAEETNLHVLRALGSPEQGSGAQAPGFKGTVVVLVNYLPST